MIEIRHYVSRAGKDIFDDWLTQLVDARAQAKIATLETLAIASLCGRDYMSCGLIGDRAIECITR